MLEIVQALENLLNAHKIAFRPIVTLIHDLGKAFVKVLLEITGMLPTLIQLYICSSSLENYARAGSTPMDFTLVSMSMSMSMSMSIRISMSMSI
jgi:hypothetical protein